MKKVMIALIAAMALTACGQQAQTSAPTATSEETAPPAPAAQSLAAPPANDAAAPAAAPANDPSQSQYSPPQD